MNAVAELDRSTFVESFLASNKPVLVRSALSEWAAQPPWSLTALGERFGHHRVQLYDTLFALHSISTFGAYITSYTGPEQGSEPPYLRWFSRQSDKSLFWADRAFAALRNDWAMPSWLPDADYVFPRIASGVDATTDHLPARGIFVCGKGGRTRLHIDPWASDACLCQATGRKRVVMYPPAAAEVLTAGGEVVDLEHPDQKRFARWSEAVSEFDEVLHPGDAVFIPGGWWHTAVALDDSVSLTWNFVHESQEPRFARYLESGGDQDETVRYFLRQRFHA